MSYTEKHENKNKQKTKKHIVFQKKEYASNKQTDQTNTNQNEKDANERQTTEEGNQNKTKQQTAIMING